MLMLCTQASNYVYYLTKLSKMITQSYSKYSGYTFSHYDLPFPARYCIPYVRFGLYQLVIRVKGIRVCALDCVCEVTSFSHGIRSLVYRRGHHAFSESSCASLGHGPRWLFLLSRQCEAISAAAKQKPCVNKDLCTRKSVRRTIKW